jgi:hypothetical protein
MSRFWPPADPRQHAYERLRSAVLASGRLPDELAAARFARHGLAGLIVWPDAEPVFSAHLIGASRAAWTPYADPRLAILAATYGLLLDTGQPNIGQRDQPYPDDLIASGQQR